MFYSFPFPREKGIALKDDFTLTMSRTMSTGGPSSRETSFAQDALLQVAGTNAVSLTDGPARSQANNRQDDHHDQQHNDHHDHHDHHHST
jgi:hypothetical protein